VAVRIGVKALVFSGAVVAGFWLGRAWGQWLEMQAGEDRICGALRQAELRRIAGQYLWDKYHIDVSGGGSVYR
jgi:hypothetical protein